MLRRFTLPLLALALLSAGCDVFGSKADTTTDEIFTQGRIDPNAVADVGYVPVQPFFTEGFGGTFQAPTDVYVGFDGFIYVTDARACTCSTAPGSRRRSSRPRSDSRCATCRA